MFLFLVGLVGLHVCFLDNIRSPGWISPELGRIVKGHIKCVFWIQNSLCRLIKNSEAAVGAKASWRGQPGLGGVSVLLSSVFLIIIPAALEFKKKTPNILWFSEGEWLAAKPRRCTQQVNIQRVTVQEDVASSERGLQNKTVCKRCSNLQLVMLSFLCMSI